MSKGNYFFLAGDGHADGFYRGALIEKYRNDCFDPNSMGKDYQSVELEKQKRVDSKYIVFLITPHMSGFEPIIDLVDSSNLVPDKTIFFFAVEDRGEQFSSHQVKSLSAIGKMVEKNGGIWFKEFTSLCDKLKKEFLS